MIISFFACQVVNELLQYNLNKELSPHPHTVDATSMPCLPLAASSKNNNNKNIPTAQNLADKGEHIVLYKIKCVCVCVCMCACVCA